MMILREIGAIEGKLVTSFRGCDITEGIYQEGKNVYNKLFKTGDIFLPNCYYFKKLLLKLSCDENKIIVLESDIDCSKFVHTPRIPEDGFVRLVTTGRLIEKKGIKYCVCAVVLLTKSNKKIEYNIIGNGILRSSLQQLIDNLRVTERVKILG